MAEGADKEGRTLAPTERRVQDAIEKGNVPVSREAAGFASLVAMLAVFSLVATPQLFLMLTSGLSSFLQLSSQIPLRNGPDAISALNAALLPAAAFVALPVGIIMAAGIVASVAQNQPRLVWTRIAPDPSRVSLRQGLSRLFGLRGLVDAFRSILKIVAIGMVCLFTLKTDWSQFVASVYKDPISNLNDMRGVSLTMAAWVTTLSAAFVAFDLFWSRYAWWRDLKMTHQEMKDEHKQQEGDPHVKVRRRQLARKLLRKSLSAAVPKATMVVVNPTHYAVALRYKREETAAPMVVAKGVDSLALKIRRIAEENDIPVIEDRLLARSLYDSVEVDRMIPPEFYKAVAGLVYYIQSKAAKSAPSSRP